MQMVHTLLQNACLILSPSEWTGDTDDDTVDIVVIDAISMLRRHSTLTQESFLLIF